MTNDRYLIYTLKGKRVRAIVPKRFGGFVLNGVVSRVHRDVLDKNISIMIQDKVYVFREPDVITRTDEHKILFIYGYTTDTDETTDEQLLDEMRTIAYHGGNIDDAMSSLDCDTTNIIAFKMKRIKSQ